MKHKVIKVNYFDADLNERIENGVLIEEEGGRLLSFTDEFPEDLQVLEVLAEFESDAL